MKQVSSRVSSAFVAHKETSFVFPISSLGGFFYFPTNVFVTIPERSARSWTWRIKYRDLRYSNLSRHSRARARLFMNSVKITSDGRGKRNRITGAVSSLENPLRIFNRSITRRPALK